MAYVINDDCISCGACAAGCPVEAISEGASHYEINADVVLIVVLVLEHVQLALLTHSSLNKIQINVHQMVFNVPERYYIKPRTSLILIRGFIF